MNTLKNEGSIRGFSQQYHGKKIVVSPKNLSGNSSQNVNNLKNVLCNVNIPGMFFMEPSMPIRTVIFNSVCCVLPTNQK